MTSLRDVLKQAAADKIAVGHFNFSDLVAFNAIVAAAREKKLPVMVGVSEGEREFTGVREAAALGAHGYLLKPIQHLYLSAAIERCLTENMAKRPSDLMGAQLFVLPSPSPL